MKINKKYIFILFTIIALMTLILFKFNNKNRSVQYIPSSNMLVHYINVGQGDCILIQVNNKNILIDGGPNNKKSFFYLKKQKIKKLDYIIITHPHEDHIGGISDIINKFNVGKIYAPKITTNTKQFIKFINTLNKKNLKIIPTKAGIKIDLGNKTKCTFLAPNNKYYKNLNNYSLVTKITHNKNTFLFSADAEVLSEEEILKNNYNLKSDVLKVGHHGSKSSTSINYLNEINPKIAIISCGKINDYGHPHKETLTKLKQKNITVYRTDIDGTILLQSDGSKIIKKH